MDVRKELFIGGVSVILSVLLVVFYAYTYKNQSTSLTISPPINQTGKSIELTATEVAKHNTPNDCWIIINNKVLKITPYLNLHPGGAGTITPYCGADASVAFNTKGGRGSHSSYAVALLENFVIGLFGENVSPDATTKTIVIPPLQNSEQDD